MRKNARNANSNVSTAVPGGGGDTILGLDRNPGQSAPDHFFIFPPLRDGGM